LSDKTDFGREHVEDRDFFLNARLFWFTGEGLGEKRGLRAWSWYKFPKTNQAYEKADRQGGMGSLGGGNKLDLQTKCGCGNRWTHYREKAGPKKLLRKKADRGTRKPSKLWP